MKCCKVMHALYQVFELCYTYVFVIVTSQKCFTCASAMPSLVNSSHGFGEVCNDLGDPQISHEARKMLCLTVLP